MRPLAFGAACLIAASSWTCAFPTHYDVYPLGVPPAWVNEAAAEWTTFTGANFSIHEGAGTYDCENDCMLVLLVPRSSVQAACGPNTIGCTIVDGDRDFARILIADDLTGQLAIDTTIHEFGHALGLQHACAGGVLDGHACPRVTTAQTIMCPEAGRTGEHVECDDVQQYDQIHGTGWGCDDARLGAEGPLHLAP